MEDLKTEKEEKILKERKDKIKNWFKNPYNLALFGILILAIAIRLYFFTYTNIQALWWDEAEYGLRAKSIAFSTPITGWAAEREIIVPLFFALLLKLGGTETLLRFVQILVSMLTVFMTYLTISEISNKKIGLIASFAMSVFWLHLFFTARVLLYLWAPLFYLLIIYFFYTGYIQDNKRNLIIFGIVASIGLQVYFSIGFLLFGIFVYLLFIEGFSLIKNKKAWLAFAIFILVLIPHMIYFQSAYGSPLPRYSIGLHAVTKEPGAGLSGIFSYINMFPSRVGWVFTIASFLGLFYFIGNFLLGAGIKGNIKKNSQWLLIFIAFFIPLSLYTFYGVVGGSATFYDGFILSTFPFFFAFGGLFLDKASELFAKYNKFLPIIIILVVLLMHAYSGITAANINIKTKISSYDSVKLAGLWIKENSQPGDIIISASVPQNTYYSERTTYSFLQNASVLEKQIEEKRPVYLVDSVWEPVEQWIHEFASKNQTKYVPVQVYFFDKEQKQPSLVIYKINY